MTVGSLLAAIRAAIVELQAPGSLDAPTERFATLLADVVAVGREASQDQRRELLDAVSELHVEVARTMARIGDELRRTGAGRKAISGYGAIRPHTTAQRVRTRA